MPSIVAARLEQAGALLPAVLSVVLTGLKASGASGRRLHFSPAPMQHGSLITGPPASRESGNSAGQPGSL